MSEVHKPIGQDKINIAGYMEPEDRKYQVEAAVDILRFGAEKTGQEPGAYEFAGAALGIFGENPDDQSRVYTNVMNRALARLMMYAVEIADMYRQQAAPTIPQQPDGGQV